MTSFVAGSSSPDPLPNLYTVRVYRSPPHTTGDRIAIIAVSLSGSLYAKVQHRSSVLMAVIKLLLYQVSGDI